MTRGMFAPTGAFFSMNFPSGPVVVEMSGEPETSAVQLSQETPGVNAFTGAFGTYTSTFGSGSTPFGAYTLPLMLVVMITVGHDTCWRHKPVHVGGMPHVLSV